MSNRQIEGIEVPEGVEARERIPLSDEQVDLLEREFDAASLILDWRKSRRMTRDIAHKAFRDLVVTARTNRQNALAANDLLSGLAHHGCFTGDCPHLTLQGCFTSLSELAGEALTFLTTPQMES